MELGTLLGNWHQCSGDKNVVGLPNANKIKYTHKHWYGIKNISTSIFYYFLNKTKHIFT